MTVYKYWRRNRRKIVLERQDSGGLDEYSLVYELKEGDAVVELCRYQGLVDYTYAALDPCAEDGDIMSENLFEFFFEPITDPEELGILFLQLSGE